VRRAAPREPPQAAQRDLDVAGAEFHLVVQIGEFAPVPDLHGAAIAAAGLTHANALRIEPIGAERRGTRRAYPFIAALMPLLLLFEPFAQRLHELVPAAQGLDLGLLGIGEL